MFIIEGNIGAGKSTLLKLIKENIPQANVVFEPVNRWDKDDVGASLLANFYKDPNRWAYTLETYAMFCRIKEHSNDIKNKYGINIMERSIYSGHYCFAKNDYIAGYLSGLEWKIYQDWFNFLTNKILPPKGFIYLQTNPELIHKRIQKRGRLSEKSISLDYLKAIHQRHEEFLIKKEGISEGLHNLPILILDANLDFETNQEVQSKFIENINSFLNTV